MAHTNDPCGGSIRGGIYSRSRGCAYNHAPPAPLLSLTRFHILPTLGVKVAKHMKYDTLPFFNTESGTYFKYFCVRQGWDNLYRGDDWWFSLDLCNEFKKNTHRGGHTLLY